MIALTSDRDFSSSPLHLRTREGKESEGCDRNVKFLKSLDEETLPKRTTQVAPYTYSILASRARVGSCEIVLAVRLTTLAAMGDHCESYPQTPLREDHASLIKRNSRREPSYRAPRAQRKCTGYPALRTARVLRHSALIRRRRADYTKKIRTPPRFQTDGYSPRKLTPVPNKYVERF